MIYYEIDLMVIIFVAVFFGAVIKGAVGIGLSLFSVPVITFFLPPTSSMILLCIPVLITNILQMEIQKGVRSFRFVPMFITLVIGIILGCNLILQVQLKTISQIIAISIIFAATVNLFGINLKFIKPHFEKIFTMFLGFFSGIIGGLSNMYAPYILCYLVSTDLNKEDLIRTIAAMYLIGSVIIFPIWIYNGLGTINDLILSSLLLVPALLGQKIGTKIRDKISNKNFKRIILYILMVIGITLLIKNIKS